MTSIKRNVTALILMLVCVFAATLTVSAAGGRTTIYMSNTAPNVGDNFTVTVQGTSPDTITVAYDPSRFTLTGGNVAYTEGGGRITFTGSSATFQFTASSEGSGYVNTWGAALEGSSVVMNVGAEGSAPQAEQPAEEQAQPEQPAEEQAQPAETAENTDGAAAPEEEPAAPPADFTGDYLIDNVSYVVSERFTDAEIPEGFYRTDVTVHGSEIYHEISNGMLTLLYLKPEANTEGSGEFYVYNEEKDTVSAFYMVGDSSRYIIVTDPGSLPTLVMVEAVCTINEKEYPCYVIDGMAENGFYFFHGVNKEFTEGWYQYDVTEGTLQRANTDVLATLTADDEVAPQEGGTEPKKEAFDVKGWLQKNRNIIAIAVFILVLLIVIVINIRVFREKSEAEEWEDYGEDDLDEEKPKAEPSEALADQVIRNAVEKDGGQPKETEPVMEEANVSDMIISEIPTENMPSREDSTVETEASIPVKKVSTDTDTAMNITEEALVNAALRESERKAPEVTVVNMKPQDTIVPVEKKPAPKPDRIPEINILDLNDL